MSNSLQFLTKHVLKFLFLLYLMTIFLLNSHVSAFEFGISPSELNFNGKAGEEICSKVNIFSSLDEINLVIEDKWSTKENPNKEINNYITNSSDLRITLNYERNFILNQEKEINICLKSKDSGNFKGILIFQALDGSLNIGIWLNVNISNPSKINRLTGFSISDFNSSIDNSIKVFLPLTILNLFLLLGLLLVYFNRNKKLNKRQLTKLSHF